jgi:hypothetical protein
MACSLCDHYVYPQSNIAASEDSQANSKAIKGYPTKFLLPGLIGES